MAHDGDPDFYPIACPGCKHVFFATCAQFPTIGARQNLCPDCFEARFLEDIGLGSWFPPRGPLS